MASRLQLRSSFIQKVPLTAGDNGNIAMSMSDDQTGAVFVECGRRASQSSVVSDLKDSLMNWYDESAITEPTRSGRFEDHYQLGRTLHQTEWTRVHLCHRKTSDGVIVDAPRIVKVIRETCSHCHEFEVLSKLDHPNFPVVHELFKLETAESEFFLVLRNYEGGTLETILTKKKNSTKPGKDIVPENQANMILWQVLVAVNYLHNLNIVHCNLRPENILLQRPNDFTAVSLISFTASFVKEDKKMNYIRGDYSGTDIVYLAPEILQDIPSYDEKCDVWACGVTLFRLLSQTLPFVYFASDTQERIRQRILKGDLQFPEKSWKHVSRAAKDFVRLLLETNPQKRPSAQKALKHVWLAEVRKEMANQCTPLTTTRSLDILGNIRQYSEAHVVDSKHHLILQLRQAICVHMISRILSNEQTRAMDDIFAAVDTDHLGQISKKQLAEGYYLAFSRVLPKGLVKGLWQRFDLAPGAGLSYSQFKVAAMGNQDWLTPANIREIFGHLDKHNKGSIGVMELMDIFAKAGINDEGIVQVMEMVDTSGSGFISFADFQRMMNLEFLAENA